MTSPERWCVLLAGLWLPATALEAQKARVKVEFRLSEPTYLPAFDAVTERPRLEDSAAAAFATLLGEQLPFLSFVRGDSAPYRLIVAIDRRDRGSTASIVEVGFHVALVGPDSLDIYWHVFRPAEAALQGLGTVDEFLAEIRSHFAQLTQADWAHLVGDLLSTVPIADTAAVWRQPLAWIIPHRRKDLCLDPRSVLKVDNVVVRAFGTSRETITADAKGDFDPLDPLPPALERLRKGIIALPLDSVTLSPDSIRVKGVYVFDYRFSREACPRLVAPTPPAP